MKELFALALSREGRQSSSGLPSGIPGKGYLRSWLDSDNKNYANEAQPAIIEWSRDDLITEVTYSQ